LQIKVDIKGMDELVGKLNKMNQMAAVRVEEQVTKSGGKIRKSGKARVAVDSGELKKAIRMKRSKDRLSATIGPQGKGAWKAHFIEFGTVESSAQPFMTPAYEENKNDYIDGMKKALNKAVDES
jgi:HK97 gp10 family phage protein